MGIAGDESCKCFVFGDEPGGDRVIHGKPGQVG